MKIPQDMLDCVAFIFCQTKNGPKAIGTGFFVEVQDRLFGEVTQIPFSMSTIYFVTARHVTESAYAFAGANGIFIRINLLKGGIENITVSISDFMQSNFNPNIDVTVAKLKLNANLHRYKAINIWNNSGLSSASSVGEGTDIFILGLFHRVYGENSNIPIVRSGSIAAMPSEKITTRFGSSPLYIVEAKSFGGLSGSPVFAVLRGYESPKIKVWIDEHRYSHREPRLETKIVMEEKYQFIGLIHGHWDIGVAQSSNGTSEISKEDLLNVNEGMALVTPKSDLLELLGEDHLKDERKKFNESLLPIMDERAREYLANQSAEREIRDRKKRDLDGI